MIFRWRSERSQRCPLWLTRPSTRLTNCRLRVERLEDRRVMAAYTVTSLADEGPGTLRDAISLANSSTNVADVIDFAVIGTVVLSTGPLTILDALTITGGPEITIDGGGVSRVFNIDDGDSTADLQVAMSQLTIRGGLVTASDAVSIAGGGIRNAEALVLSQVTVHGNSARLGGGIAVVKEGTVSANGLTLQNNATYYSGGGAYVAPTAGLTITGGVISGNSAGLANATSYSSFGGGIYSTGRLTLSDVTITGNVVTHTSPGQSGGFGGGIAVRRGAGSSADGSTLLTQVQVTGNSATRGGGIHVGSGSATIANSHVANNTAAQGAGLFLSGQAVVQGSTLQGNVTSGVASNPPIAASGGGAFVGPGALLTMEGSQVLENSTAGRGGGIYASSLGTSNTSRLELRNTTITGNVAGQLGGGLCLGQATQLTLEDSHVMTNQAAVHGGALYASSFGTSQMPRLEIHGSTLSGNTAASGVGGGLALGTNVQATVDHSAIDNNRAWNRGGGIYISNLAGGAEFSSTLTLENSQVSGNQLMATSGTSLGGGILAGTRVHLTITDCLLSLNDADAGSSVTGMGGGAYLSAFGTFQNVSITRTQIVNNRADTVAGGGLLISQRSNTTILESTISGNVSGGDGGGVQVIFGGIASVRRSTLVGNEAMIDGGAVSVFDSTLDLENCTVSGNSANNDGGGIWAAFTPILSSVKIQFTTITGNAADVDEDAQGYGGGGVAVVGGSPVEIRNSIVAGNSEGSGFQAADLADAAGSAIVAYSLIDDLIGHSVMSGAFGNIVGEPAMLGPLSDNGGPTLTHLPEFGSPAVNSADPAAPMMEDQRGLARPVASRSDMGSIEVTGGSPPIDGDFDNDGDYDCADINALSTAIVLNGSPSMYDLNGDMELNEDDLDSWLAEAGVANLGPGLSYLNGDATLDGAVDGSDFGRWNAHKFTSNTNWCEGDFNADGIVDGSDFGIWNSNKFQVAGAPARQAVTSVPDHPRIRSPRETLDASIARNGVGGATRAVAPAQFRGAGEGAPRWVASVPAAIARNFVATTYRRTSMNLRAGTSSDTVTGWRIRSSEGLRREALPPIRPFSTNARHAARTSDADRHPTALIDAVFASAAPSLD